MVKINNKGGNMKATTWFKPPRKKQNRTIELEKNAVERHYQKIIDAAKTPLEQIEEKEVNCIINKVLSSLSERERSILMMRFGLDDIEYTLVQAGEKMGCSNERIRQIEAIALRKLRHPSKMNLIKTIAPFSYDRYIQLLYKQKKQQEWKRFFSEHI